MFQTHGPYCSLHANPSSLEWRGFLGSTLASRAHLGTGSSGDKDGDLGLAGVTYSEVRGLKTGIIRWQVNMSLPVGEIIEL